MIKLLKMRLIMVLSAITVEVYNAEAIANGFYDGVDKYRGFYWFENSTKPKKDKNYKRQCQIPTPQEALDSIEARRKELDDTRNQMIELGFRSSTPPHILRQAVLNYKRLEARMYDGAIRLAAASDMVNFTNPEIANLHENPTNVFANKLKRQELELVREVRIKEFAQKFDLLLFADENCGYCQAFLPILRNFINTNGFNLEITSLSGPQGKAASSLGITAVPTLVAVSKDGKQLFEIARGFASLAELETNVILASKWLEELQDKRGLK